MKRSVRTIGVLACGISVGVAGLIGQAADADPGARSQTFDLTIGYDCAFPAGPGSAAVRVTATAPVRARVGEPVRLMDASLTVSVSPSVVADLGAVTVGGMAALTVDSAGWVGSAPDVPMPAEGDLVLDFPVEAPEVTATAAGDLVFTARLLSVTLAPKLGDGTSTDPPTVQLTCAPAPGQDPTIGAISVSGGSTSESPPTPGDEPAEPGTPDFTPRAVIQGEVPPDCHPIPPPPGLPTSPLCTYLMGYSNIAKLGAAVKQPAGIVNVAANRFQFNCKPGWLCQQANVEASLDGKPQLPAAESSLLPFGFVPTTATMQLTQVGLGFVDMEATMRPPDAGLSVATTEMVARVFDVEVNGVPLDVGPNCQTREPIVIELTATFPSYSITEGGPLDGVVTIPPFSGCGTTEDLDAVVSGLVSGPGNYVKIGQGNVCTINTGSRCPPSIRDPLD